jgi:hypothetical protein
MMSVRGGANLRPDDIGRRATNAFASLCEHYDATGRAVNFDFRAHCTNWAARGDHFTHRLHRYPARLTPYIPLFFFSVRGVAVRSGRLLDPFAGCGTVLVEAPVHPVNPMHPVGLEINPLARLIAKVKTTPLDRRAVLDCWRRIVGRYEADRSQAGLPSFPNKRHWLSESVERGLARAKRSLNGVRDSDLLDFFLVALSSVVRHVALADPSVSVPVKLDPTRFENPNVRKEIRDQLEARNTANVLRVLDTIVHKNVARLDRWQHAARISVAKSTIVGADARTFSTARYEVAGALGKPNGLRVSGVDLVLTSPPYANAQRYTRSLRLELFVLGYTETARDESVMDRLQIGTERIAKDAWDEIIESTGSWEADRVVSALARRDRYRAAIVGKYVRDMNVVVNNCYGALRRGGHLILVIGNNCVRGRLLNNAGILADLAVNAGFRVRLRVKNRIPSRALLTDRHPTAGVITHEHVLVLRKP